MKVGDKVKPVVDKWIPNWVGDVTIVRFDTRTRMTVRIVSKNHKDYDVYSNYSVDISDWEVDEVSQVRQIMDKYEER